MKILSHSARQKIRRYLPVSIKKIVSDPIYREILGFFEGHPEEENNYLMELRFLREDGLASIPYSWIREYYSQTIQVAFDNERQLHFVMHKGKRLYFPRGKSANEISNAYRALLIEQDVRSPHSYQTDYTKGIHFDSLMDVGAAEGILALEMIEDVEKVVLCECSPQWVDALEATFFSYKDKVMIVKKTASNRDSETTISINTLMEQLELKNTLIKIDVEGSEQKVLDGMEWGLGNVLAVFCCTYHRARDAELFEERFRNLGFRTQLSQNYLLLLDKGVDVVKPPYFRKGLLRAFYE